MRLKGKTAVLTGAAGGIGIAIAQRFIQEGIDTLILLDLKIDALEKFKENLVTSAHIICLQGDLSDTEETKQLFLDLVTQHKKIDILVNNAGITQDAMFHKMTDSQWDNIIAANLKSVYNCTKGVINCMREQNYGKIVNMSSVSSFGNLGQTNYSASKAALIGFTKSLAKESAAKNITVNAIAPSYVATGMLMAVPEKVLEKFKAAVPMNRLAEPSEIASVVVFLTSDDSSFITGECIVVSGGSYM